MSNLVNLLKGHFGKGTPLNLISYNRTIISSYTALVLRGEYCYPKEILRENNNSIHINI